MQSKFEDYNEISKFYDNLREPMGYMQIVEQLENPAEAMILDAGAGSGNYSFKLCHHVKRLVAFEVNDGMISQWKAKQEAHRAMNVEIIQGSLLEDLRQLE